MKEKKEINKQSKYYVLECRSENMMLLYEPESPSFDDDWIFGQKFTTKPKEPIEVQINPGDEHRELLPFFCTATLMSDAFYETLKEAGVKNMDVYDAVIKSEDAHVSHKGYKAFNLLGMIGNDDFKAGKTQNLPMFRLTTYMVAVIVTEEIKQAIEAKKFPHIVFTSPNDFIRV
jgi:hypothetical protein